MQDVNVSPNATLAKIICLGPMCEFWAFAMGDAGRFATFAEAKAWCIAQGATQLEYNHMPLALFKAKQP